MLDLVGILFSSIIMFLVILRAVQTDSVEPWFRPPKTGTDSSGLKLNQTATPDGRETRRGVVRGEWSRH
jgi:hypothetical protein